MAGRRQRPVYGENTLWFPVGAVSICFAVFELHRTWVCTKCQTQEGGGEPGEPLLCSVHQLHWEPVGCGGAKG